MPPARRAAKKPAPSPVETRYVQPKGAVVQPRVDLQDVDTESPLPTWVGVPHRLRDQGYSRMTLAVAWRLAGRQWDRVQPGPDGDLIVH